MPIDYYLRDNQLTAEPGDFMAVVRAKNTADLNTVIDRMVAMGSTVTRADILSVFQDFQTALLAILREGNAVVTPFANFRSSIKGVFNGRADSFDSSRHQVMPVINPGIELRNLYRSNLSTNKQEGTDKLPTPLDITDHASGEINSLVTPGSMVTVQGHRLHYDPSDPEQGVFFVDADGSESRVSVIGLNKPSRLMFLVPQNLGTGDYSVVIRTRPGAKLLSGELPVRVTVS